MLNEARVTSPSSLFCMSFIFVVTPPSGHLYGLSKTMQSYANQRLIGNSHNPAQI